MRELTQKEEDLKSRKRARIKKEAEMPALAAYQAWRVSSADWNRRVQSSARDISKQIMEGIRLPERSEHAEKGFIFTEKFRGRFVIGTKNIDQINVTINSRGKK